MDFTEQAIEVEQAGFDIVYGIFELLDACVLLSDECGGLIQIFPTYFVVRRYTLNPSCQGQDIDVVHGRAPLSVIIIQQPSVYHNPDGSDRGTEEEWGYEISCHVCLHLQSGAPIIFGRLFFEEEYDAGDGRDERGSDQDRFEHEG